MLLGRPLIEAIFAAALSTSPALDFPEVAPPTEPDPAPVLQWRGLALSTPGIARPADRNALTPEDPSVAIAIGRQLRGLDLELSVTHAFDGSPYDTRLEELSAAPAGAFDLTVALTAAYKF